MVCSTFIGFWILSSPCACLCDAPSIHLAWPICVLSFLDISDTVSAIRCVVTTIPYTSLPVIVMAWNDLSLWAWNSPRSASRSPQKSNYVTERTPASSRNPAGHVSGLAVAAGASFPHNTSMFPCLALRWCRELYGCHCVCAVGLEMWAKGFWCVVSDDSLRSLLF